MSEPRYFRKFHEPEFKVREELDAEKFWADFEFLIDWGKDRYHVHFRGSSWFYFDRSMPHKKHFVEHMISTILRRAGVDLRKYNRRVAVPLPVHQLIDRGIPQGRFYQMVVLGLVKSADYELREA